MKLVINIHSGGIYLTTGILFLALFFQSCTTKYVFNNSFVVPAAEGFVKVSKNKNDNFKIMLDVKRLADPKRLNPSKDVYVVWMETKRNGIKNIGQLKTSGSFLSKELKSSLETQTSFKPVAFFITAEDMSGIQYPEGQVVLRTHDTR